MLGPEILKKREERTSVKLSAQMRAGGKWADVAIRNVSAHGMLLSAAEAPQIGSFLEVRRGPVMLAVRTVWRDSGLFGVRAQDRIDVNELTTGTAAPITAAALEAVVKPAKRSRTCSEDGETSRFFGRKVQFLFVLALLGSGVIALGGSLQTFLYQPMQQVKAGFTNP